MPTCISPCVKLRKLLTHLPFEEYGYFVNNVLHNDAIGLDPQLTQQERHARLLRTIEAFDRRRQQLFETGAEPVTLNVYDELVEWVKTVELGYAIAQYPMDYAKRVIHLPRTLGMQPPLPSPDRHLPSSIPNEFDAAQFHDDKHPVRFDPINATLMLPDLPPWTIRGKSQLAVVDFLYAQSRQSQWCVSAKTILNAVYGEGANGRSRRIQAIFKDNPEWETYIKRFAKGIYGFNLPPR